MRHNLSKSSFKLENLSDKKLQMKLRQSRDGRSRFSLLFVKVDLSPCIHVLCVAEKSTKWTRDHFTSRRVSGTREMSTSYYHVTFTTNIESIKAQGIYPGFWPSWEHQRTGGRLGPGDEIHAFTHYVDAVRWASHMECEFFRTMGSGSVVIVEFTPEGKWREDKTSDPLCRATMKGIRKTSRTPVWPERICMIEVLTPDICDFVAAQTKLKVR